MKNAAKFISLSPQVDRPGAHALRHTHWVFPVETNHPEKFITSLWNAGIDATKGASNLMTIPAPPETGF
jgi:perosamine synthetase